MNDSIVAVVVTYNRLAVLKECVSAIRNQSRLPIRIIIVNNASTDGSRMYLNDLMNEHRELITAIHLDRNTGGAGGFNEGIRLAYWADAEWIWLMDDDCIPQLDCLEKLLDAKDLLQKKYHEIGFIASRVLWIDRTPCLMNVPFQHSLWIEPHALDHGVSRIAGASFVSLLISRAAVKQHGLPVKEFFIWFDDVEYTRRIASTLRGYLATNSIAIHKTSKNNSALDFNQLDINSLWKFKYGIRNQCSFHFENEGTVEGLLFIGKILKRLFHVHRSWSLRLPIIKSCFQGYLFRYHRYIERI